VRRKGDQGGPAGCGVAGLVASMHPCGGIAPWPRSGAPQRAWPTDAETKSCTASPLAASTAGILRACTARPSGGASRSSGSRLAACGCCSHDTSVATAPPAPVQASKQIEASASRCNASAKQEQACTTPSPHASRVQASVRPHAALVVHWTQSIDTCD
jgi:hypothetical protein